MWVLRNRLRRESLSALQAACSDEVGVKAFDRKRAEVAEPHRTMPFLIRLTDTS